MNENIETLQTLRLPRPLGLTTLSHHHQHKNTEKTKSTLINHILTSYITTGFTFMGSPCSIEQLSLLTGIPSASILKGIAKATTGLANLTNPEQLQETIRALQSVAINGSLRASGDMAEQASILRASQGNQYKAFISSTYNIALKNSLDASKQLMEFSKSLQGPQGTTVNIQNNLTQTNEAKVSPAQVVQMVEEQNGRISPNEDEETKAQLFLDHNIGDMPEVDARLQTDKGGNEGLNMKDITKLDANTEPINHDNRREEEYGIDDKADQV